MQRKRKEKRRGNLIASDDFTTTHLQPPPYNSKKNKLSYALHKHKIIYLKKSWSSSSQLIVVDKSDFALGVVIRPFLQEVENYSQSTLPYDQTISMAAIRRNIANQ